MVRNIVVFGGSSHPQLTETICNHLGIPPAKIILGKFSVGETRVEIQESVRGKDVYIIQSGGGGKVNDHFIELLVTISACQTASAQRVTAVLPMFPYSRQSDIPYNKIGAPLARDPIPQQSTSDQSSEKDQNGTGSSQKLNTVNLDLASLTLTPAAHNLKASSGSSTGQNELIRNGQARSNAARANGAPTNDGTKTAMAEINGEDFAGATHVAKPPNFEPQRGYRQWVAQAGTLIADLLTCAGADHVITMDLHDPQYQGYFDIPVDNLYGRHLLRRYIQYQIPHYLEAVIVSPDAGGAKRATGIADSLGMPFALIHKERRPARTADRQNAHMILVGDVSNRTAILVDDLADTANTITRAAKLLKMQGAKSIIALVTHGVLSGDAIDRINASAIDKLVVTNSVDQADHLDRCPKLEVLEVGTMFAEAIRRVHHGESISVLFQYD